MREENSKIVWGIAAIVLIFVALLVIPKGLKMLANAGRADAQSSVVVLTAFDPTTGPPGTSVTLYGNGFTSSNTVNFGATAINNINSADGTTLTFTVPSTLPDGITPLPAGDYAVDVANSSGTSNSYAFTVTCAANNTNCNSSTGTYNGPVFLCSGASDCIQGFKVPIGGVADHQTVSLDARFIATTTSYSFDGLGPGLHTVSVTVPNEWYAGYTLCINSINCHSDIPIQGDSVSINFLTQNVPPYLDQNGLINVPAGSYIDLYWHFSQNFTDFASAPAGLNNGGTGSSSTSTPVRSNAGQVASYTGGRVSTTEDPNAVAGIAQATTNALGCTLAQILTPAIRGVIAGDQSLLAPPQPVRSGGGGASIIVNAVGDTGPLNVTQLPAINAYTKQAAVDVRTGRAATIGFPNQPSWDAVSYCLENAMLKYIQQSTVNWMYTAFNGNPAFVQNLSQFMLGIENQTAKNYFNQLQTQNTGAPFQGQVLQDLVSNYNQSKGGVAPYNAAAVNQTGLDGWFAMTQNDSNNIYGAEQQDRQQLATAIHNNIENEHLKYLANNGTLNVDDCSGSTKPDALGQPTNCKSQNTGFLINQGFGANAYLANQRLANNSGNYDQIVTQLVNQLIQTVLGKVFSGH